jgi:outer membrane protein OmpA-like peptidoglycan-associated protein
MRQIAAVMICMLALTLHAQVGVNDQYILSIITLKDKSDKPIPNKSVKIANPDGSVAVSGQTDASGEFKTKLKRGITYSVSFSEGGQEWYFDVPVSTDASATYFKTSCKILVDQGQGGTAVTKPLGDKNCELRIDLVKPDGTPIKAQKVSFSKISGEKIGDYFSNDAGQITLSLKQGLVMKMSTVIGTSTFSSNITVPFSDKSILEISLGSAADANPNDPNADKCKVNFSVTDDIGVAEGTAVVKVKLNGTLVYTGQTDIEGKCSTYLDQHNTYEVIVEKFGKTFNLKLEMPAESHLSEYDCSIKIKVVEEYVRTYTLDNVYFDVNKYELKPASYPALDQLFNAMKASPTMSIELAGHTDSDGNDEDNMILSQRRADAVKKYLTDKGIASNRILTKGYGEKVPLVENNSDANKAKNRRTEVRVITE